jgi:rod shape-determining protein MreC
METFFNRYRNPTTLGAVLLIQLLGLAVQVKRPLDPAHPDTGSVRLIRLWAEGVLSPFERAVVASSRGIQNAWHNYVNVGAIRSENQQLRAQNERLQLELARLAEDAGQAHRLQTLLDFKEKFVTQTMAAQVIGTSGTEQSRVIYIDKGSADGLKPDMAVITPAGVAGKIRDVFHGTSQVLLINDSLSGAGAILGRSRLYGVVKGDGSQLYLDHIMSDEKVDVGEPVLTSGGDGIFPKGLPIGTVADVSPGPDLFLKIRVKPAADLDRLDEVLVITQIQSQLPLDANASVVRAADILAQRLPGLKQPASAALPATTTGAQKQGTPAPLVSAKSAATGEKKPAQTVTPSAVGSEKKPAQPISPGAAAVDKPKAVPVSEGETKSAPKLAPQSAKRPGTQPATDSHSTNSQATPPPPL